MRALLRRLFSVYLVGIPFLASSCIKDIEPDYVEILTGKRWQINEIRYVQNNRLYYYKRGATSGVNVNLDDAYIKFNKDGTGDTQWNGKSYTLTWNYLNNERSKLTFTMQGVSPLSVNWEEITYSESMIKYTEYYNTNGVISLAHCSRTPKSD